MDNFAKCKIRIPQGQLLFLIFINDLGEVIVNRVVKFTGDTTLFQCVETKQKDNFDRYKKIRNKVRGKTRNRLQMERDIISKQC